MFRLASRLALSVTLCAAFALAAQAQLVDATHSFTSTFSSGGLSGTAAFSVDANGCLVVDLTSTTQNVKGNNQVLTGLFFDVAGNPTFSDVSLTGDGYVHGTSTDTPAQHWAYKAGISGDNPFNANYGFATAGLGVFGPGDVIQTGATDPASPVIDGADFGLVGSVSATPQNGLASPLIQDSVTTTLCETAGSGAGSYTISNINAQFGTAFGENAVPTPPAALVMMAGGGLAWLRLLRPRLRRKS